MHICDDQHENSDDRASALALVRMEFEQILGQSTDVRLVISSQGKETSTRVFESEQLNLHSEARVGGGILAESLVKTVQALRIRSSSDKRIENICAGITAWLLSEAQSALDVLHAGGLCGEFECCSGGPSFDHRVFVWCEGVLTAAAGLLRGKCLEYDIDSISSLSMPTVQEMSEAARRVLSTNHSMHPLLLRQVNAIALDA